MALKQVRDFKKVMVYDRDESLLARYTKEVASVLNVKVVPAAGKEGPLLTRSQFVTFPAQVFRLLKDERRLLVNPIFFGFNFKRSQNRS